MLAAGFVDTLLAHFGYAAVAALILLESLGVPLPGETILLAAAVYSGATEHLSIVAIVIIAGAAATAGNLIGFGIGYAGGYRLLVRYGPRLHIHTARIKLARYLFAEHGVWIVLVGRFIAVLRTYAALLAGTARMPLAPFIACTVISSAAWAALFGFGSFYLGTRLTAAGSSAEWLLLGVAAIVVVAIAVAIHRGEGRLIARAEARYPGPLEAP